MTAELNSHKRKRTLEWTPELDKDFEELKAAFKRSTLRHHLVTDKDHRLPGIELSIDFSSKAVAAVISQNTDGHPRFIAAAGRKLKDYESRYHSSKGELLALHFALTQFSHLLTSSKFKVFTDSTTVVNWQTMKGEGLTVSRWLDTFLRYDFDVIFRKGKDNTNADAISRTPELCGTPSEVSAYSDLVAPKQRMRAVEAVEPAPSTISPSILAPTSVQAGPLSLIHI